MVAFYEATDGTNWNDNSNWLSAWPLNTWFGVKTDNTGRVIELALIDNNLQGEIPAEIAELGSLNTLALWNNQLTGEIPPELGNLTKLRSLSLDGNDLTGTVPTELGNLDGLQELWLDGNQLSGCFPSGLADVPSIDFSLVPCTDHNALEALYIATNGANWTNNTNWLSDRPLDEWHGITTNRDGTTIQLDLSNNQLNGEIPTELGDIPNLQSLFLFGNNIQGEIPTELGNLTSLKRLFVSGNNLSGCIPINLQDVPNNDLGVTGLPYCDLADAETTVAPVTLIAFSTSADQMNLTWSTTSDDVARQEIFRDGESIALPQPGQTWFTESGLAPNTRYEYRLELNMADGSTVVSETAQVATLAQVPLMTPMNVKETEITVAIVGGNSQEETTYSITLWDDEQTVTSEWATSKCRTIAGLRPVAEYRFEVVARNFDGFESSPVYSIYYGGPDEAESWGTQRATGVDNSWGVTRADDVASLYGLSPQARQWMTSDILFEWVRNEPGFAGYGVPGDIKIGSAVKPTGLMHEFMHGYFEHWDGFADPCDVMNIYSFRQDFAQFMLRFREYDHSQQPNPWEEWRPIYNYFVSISRDFINADGETVWELLEDRRFNELWHAVYHVAETDLPVLTAGKIALVPPPLRRYFENFLSDTEGTNWEDELAWYTDLPPAERRLWDTAYTYFEILRDSPEYGRTSPSFAASIAESTRNKLMDIERASLVDFVNTLEDISCNSNCEKLWEADFDFWGSYVDVNLYRSQFHLDEISPDIGIELEESNLNATKRALGILVSDLYCGSASASTLRVAINAVPDLSEAQSEAFLQMIEVRERAPEHWHPLCVR